MEYFIAIYGAIFVMTIVYAIIFCTVFKVNIFSVFFGDDD